MKVIENKYIPFKGFVALNLFGFVFVRKKEWSELSCVKQDAILQHEAIHSAQMIELGFIGFYIAYFFEWIYRLIFHTKTAYRGISFEREAYDHQHDFGYLYIRLAFAQWRRK